MNLTILICTHNRASLLIKTLNSLNQALRPANSHIDIMVVAPEIQITIVYCQRRPDIIPTALVRIFADMVAPDLRAVIIV